MLQTQLFPNLNARETYAVEAILYLKRLSESIQEHPLKGINQFKNIYLLDILNKANDKR